MMPSSRWSWMFSTVFCWRLCALLEIYDDISRHICGFGYSLHHCDLLVTLQDENRLQKVFATSFCLASHQPFTDFNTCLQNGLVGAKVLPFYSGPRIITGSWSNQHLDCPVSPKRVQLVCLCTVYIQLELANAYVWIVGFHRISFWRGCMLLP